MASEREPKMNEVTCRGCGSINPVELGTYTSGIKTIFCKGCGEEIMMTFKRSPDGLELKRSDEV